MEEAGRLRGDTDMDMVKSWPWKAKGPWLLCLVFFWGGEQLPSYVGNIISHYKDLYWTSRIQWKVRGLFFMAQISPKYINIFQNAWYVLVVWEHIMLKPVSREKSQCYSKLMIGLRNPIWPPWFILMPCESDGFEGSTRLMDLEKSRNHGVS